MYIPTHRDDSGRVDLRMGSVVVNLGDRDTRKNRHRSVKGGGNAGGLGTSFNDPHLDVVKVGRVFKGRVIPVEVLEPSVELGVVVSDKLSALEVTSVDWVVTDDGRVQTDVGLRQGVADQEVLALEDALESLEGLVQREDVALVRGLGRGEAGFVAVSKDGWAGGGSPR